MKLLRLLTSRLLSSNCHIQITRSCSYSSKLPKQGPDLNYFLQKSSIEESNVLKNGVTSVPSNEFIPYIKKNTYEGQKRKVFFDVYGCQMNVNDTEIAWSILQSYGYVRTQCEDEANVVLIVTCSIRDGAEQKIWNRIKQLKNKRKNMLFQGSHDMKIGILGCMAERLKHKLIEGDNRVDLVAGPDSYRDLPRLLALADDSQEAINVQLSLDETYADVNPVRLDQNAVTAYVSIMRGCDNMCSYCIVPFTRGRERSRPIKSIVDEVSLLVEQGIKEVTLLGQNVNSYCDISEVSHSMNVTELSKGFRTIYRNKGGGLRFSTLLEKVAQIHPELRIRFTSPHPKDFPDQVLSVISSYPNICNNLHLPVQCGSNKVLESMRRGYTREAYLTLVQHVTDIIPDVHLSSDFICGFCGESEEDFELTLSLMREVQYHNAFLFAYSMRERTHAHRRFKDDVPENVKLDRLSRMITLYREQVSELNQQQVGSQQLVLIEGVSRRSPTDLAGRNDGNTKVILPKCKLPDSNGNLREIKPGDYVNVKITSSTSQILKGYATHHTTLQRFFNEHTPQSQMSSRL